MRLPHLYSVGAGPEAFAELWQAAAAAGVRLGWLDLEGPAEPPGPLAGAVGLGAAKAVAAGGRRTVAVKRLAGEPVLRDLVREHFLGCAALLVRGRAGFPRLEARPGGLGEVSMEGAAPVWLAPDAFLARLHRPRARG